MEETKRRNSGSGSSESGRRSDRRYETESRDTKESGLRINETGQNRDYKESDADIRENLQRRSHETESRSLPQKNRATISDRRGNLDWGGSESRRRFDEGTPMRHEVTQSSAYSVRPSEKDCWHYLRNGACSYGSGCRFNHPIHLRRNCQFFLRGACKNGSACRFHHPVDRDDAEPTHQARSPDRRASESSGRFDEKRHEIGSSSRPEKRARTIPDSRDRDPRKRFEDINQRCDETVAGSKRARLEPGQGNSEWQRREGQEDVQEQRLKEMQEKRARDQEEERLRDIDRQRRKARMRLDRMKQTVQFDESHTVKKTLGVFGFERGDGDGL